MTTAASPRALFSILFNAEKAIDVVVTARALGVLEMLDSGPVTLREICERTRAKPNRMYKLLDCLESLGLVSRQQTTDDRLDASYRSTSTSTSTLSAAADAVFGPSSIERDRDRYDWRAIHGKLPEVLDGSLSIESFDWPPRTPDQVAGFEASMAAGSPPIIESFLRARDAIFFAKAPPRLKRHARDAPQRPQRWLDVGGGDGTLSARVLAELPHVRADIFNLPSTEPLVLDRVKKEKLEGRLGFIGGDFFEDDALPGGYDVVSFVRVLHDWDERRARELLAKGAKALAPGGRLVVCEEFRTQERLAVQFFWTYFLMGVDPCESRLREVEFYLCELRALGFQDVRVLPGAFDVIIAQSMNQTL